MLLLPVSYKVYKHNWCKSSLSNPLKYLNASQKWTYLMYERENISSKSL